MDNIPGFCTIVTGKEKHMTCPEQWPPELPVVGVRVARPTDRLEAVVAFYRDGLGLPVIDSFEGHAGYSGVMLGLPGASYHLEFTHHEAGSDCPAPSKDKLLVLYLSERTAMERHLERLSAMGYPSVPPENPYWGAERSVTIEDPDGWRVVLMLMSTYER
jgi:catechol 2,3-dioxygenase-like lactoylglutathione lyase family enzyme